MALWSQKGWETGASEEILLLTPVVSATLCGFAGSAASQALPPVVYSLQHDIHLKPLRRFSSRIIVKKNNFG